MKPQSKTLAAITQSTPQELALSGAWTASSIGESGTQAWQFDQLPLPENSEMVIEASRIEALDTAGAWVLNKLLRRLRDKGVVVQVSGLAPEFAGLLDAVGQQAGDQPKASVPVSGTSRSTLESLGKSSAAAFEQAVALLAFVGECAQAFAGCITHPSRFRWRPILHNIRSAGVDALPIVGLLSFLLGIVVAYQGANQLR